MLWQVVNGANWSPFKRCIAFSQKTVARIGTQPCLYGSASPLCISAVLASTSTTSSRPPSDHRRTRVSNSCSDHDSGTPTADSGCSASTDTRAAQGVYKGNEFPASVSLFERPTSEGHDWKRLGRQPEHHKKHSVSTPAHVHEENPGSLGAFLRGLSDDQFCVPSRPPSTRATTIHHSSGTGTLSSTGKVAPKSIGSSRKGRTGRSSAHLPPQNSVAIDEAEYIAGSLIDGSAAQKVKQFLQQSQRGAASAVISEPISVELSRSEQLKRCSLEFVVNHHRVIAVGFSRLKKVAQALCYMHAMRLIDHYSVDIPASNASSPPPKPLRELPPHMAAHSPVVSSPVVTEAAALLERRPAQPGDHLALQHLNARVKGASKNMIVTGTSSTQFVATLTLHAGLNVRATGTAPSRKEAKQRCALHALAILKLLRKPREGAHETGSAVGVASPHLSSAPLTSIIQSLSTRLATLYTFYQILFAETDGPPSISFAREQGGAVYVCTLTINEVTCEGRGVNRFESERAAVEAVLSEMELYDERLQVLNTFLALHPTIVPENIPRVTLPTGLQQRIEDCVKSIDQRFTTTAVSTESPLAAAAAESTSATDRQQQQQQPLTTTMTEEEQAFLKIVSAQPNSGTDSRAAPTANEIGDGVYAAHMRARLRELHASALYLNRFHARRQTLAIAAVESDILAALETHRAVVVCGTTGCGKTTQVPQFLLDDAIRRGCADQCNIIVTQPRRISAFSVAERIANERLSILGDDVGYAVRLDYRPGRHITLCTTGVLLQILSSHPNLEHVSHIIIDEVHERDINCDVILALTKQLLKKNKALKVVLMSATVQAGVFTDYFDKAPVIQVDGAVYPVAVKYLDDIAAEAEAAAGASGSRRSFHSRMFDVVTQEKRGCRKRGSDAHRGQHALLVPPKTDYGLIAHIVHHSITVDMKDDTRGKSILVFLPGWRELLAAKSALESYEGLGGSVDASRFYIILLHSTVDTKKQRECFDPAPPGKIKVVLATNIAESGITIDDAAVVIDAGLIKQTTWAAATTARARQEHSESVFGRFGASDSRDVSTKTVAFSTQLSLQYASQANCTQRKGRAGRTQGGVCYRLFTKDTWEALPPFLEAEIHRVPLTQVLLKLLSLGYTSPHDILNTFLEPPSPFNVTASMQQLKSLGAVDALGALTPLGKYLSKLPCDPRIGKMIMMGAVMQCLDSVLTVAATSDVCPYVSSREVAAEVRAKRLLFARGAQSDHVSFLNAFNAYCADGERLDFAHHNYMNPGNMSVISRYKHQYREILLRSGFISDTQVAPQSSMGNDGNECIRHPDSPHEHGDGPSMLATKPPALPPYNGSLCVDTSSLSQEALDVSLVKACVCSALFPNIAMLELSATSAPGTKSMSMGGQKASKAVMRTNTHKRITPSRDSACRRLPGATHAQDLEDEGSDNDTQATETYVEGLLEAASTMERRAGADGGAAAPVPPSMLYVFEEVFGVKEARKDFLTHVTSISVWALLLFGATEVNSEYNDVLGMCVVERWVAVLMDPGTFQAITALRRALHECVWRKYKSPLDTFNNDALGSVRELCKEVLKAPTGAGIGPTTSDAGSIISPVVQANCVERSSCLLFPADMGVGCAGSAVGDMEDDEDGDADEDSDYS